MIASASLLSELLITSSAVMATEPVSVFVSSAGIWLCRT